jgi:hypothetical protein
MTINRYVKLGSIKLIILSRLLLVTMHALISMDLLDHNSYIIVG